ncbi:CoA transferase [Actinomadura sp. WMMB 499]|uniref:CoA transferase n=1 Tax=Actinomadura sp. WMMB 499 TaxID=1219491 RepID=UPI001245E369|nr:CoA transferase [Actinomadura sp. WMMB 499]QFG22289.1 CoA transferase [Actinomadura sp. WMMB 499]
MAHPATAAARAEHEDLGLHVTGPPAITEGAVRHLRLLGAADLLDRRARPLTAAAHWAAGVADTEVTDEATAQAATGVMHVHGRRDGAPRGPAADYLTTAAAVITAQAILAASLGRARGMTVDQVATGADLAGLVAVGQYLAAGTAEEPEAVPLTPGGPPFVTSDGVRFEVETLDAGVWAAFWAGLGVPERVAGAGWRSFQFRYATACSPVPAELHAAARAAAWKEVLRVGGAAGASLCALRSLRDRLDEPVPDAPWTLASLGAAAPVPVPDGGAAPARPLEGMVVLEAGRRIQAPLAACALGWLGAEVVRIEPPGGDPLRGMPPVCGGVSARWLALNRGKRAVEIDIKTAAGRAELYELAAGADAFVHNWAPGAAERLELDDAHLRRANPGLVYAYTSGWAGRLDDAPLGTDFMVQARTGVAEAVRARDEDTAPSLMTLLDVLGGLMGAEAVLAALLRRHRTGRGVRVDSSLLGAAEELTRPALARVRAGGPARAPEAFRRPIPAGDGWVAVHDADADAAGPLSAQVAGMDTQEALELLRGKGMRCTAVTTALDRLPDDDRFAGLLTRDVHGAMAVPVPWRLA